MGQHLYRHFDASGALLYVGVSLSAVQRLAQHKNCSHWFEQIARVEIETFTDRQQALDAERKAVATEKPRHNVQGGRKVRPQSRYSRQAKLTKARAAKIRALVTRGGKKLTWAKVAEIRRRASFGVTQRTISVVYGVSEGTVHRILRNKSWRLDQGGGDAP